MQNWQNNLTSSYAICKTVFFFFLLSEFIECSTFSAILLDHVLAITIRQTSTENVQGGREVSNVLCVVIEFSH